MERETVSANLYHQFPRPSDIIPKYYAALLDAVHCEAPT